MRTALKSRDNQTLMDIDDFTTWLLTRKHKALPYTEADKGMASAEFKRLCEASPGDVEGEGVEMQLWGHPQQNEDQGETKARSNANDLL